MRLISAWRHSPGPDCPRDYLMLALKGFIMGCADIIPGVSGGTMAFITGIYPRLIAAINSFNLDLVKNLLRWDLPAALAGVHLRFLIPLLLGIAVAVVSAARVINDLMIAHPQQVWSFFFGLIAASVIVVAREVKHKTPAMLAVALLAAVAAYFLVGLIPLTTPNDWWFLFLCGMLAICAMILPGISGAFILLILGKYQFMTAALKNPFVPLNLAYILIFLAGAVVGIIAFAKLLKYLLDHFPNLTMAGLAGFMIGAMRKIWPWKETLETRLVDGKEIAVVQQNVLPAGWDAALYVCLGLMLLGFILVMMLDRVAGNREEA